ncbi:MAG: hypothetical protein WBD02_00350 [Acidimicrobiia bacterium]
MIPIILILAGVMLALFVAYERAPDPIEAALAWCRENSMPSAVISHTEVHRDRARVTCEGDGHVAVLELARDEDLWTVESSTDVQ